MQKNKQFQKLMTSVMVPNWKTWCRLCAREDPNKMHINFRLKNEIESAYLDAISKHFSIDVNLIGWPETICTRCHQYVTEFIDFAHRTSKVQTMFAELFNNNNQMDLEQLRARYELKEIGDDKLAINQNLDPKPNIGEFEFIDEVMLEPLNIKTEHTDEEDINASDNEYQPEDDSSDDESIIVTTKRENEECDEEIEDEKPKIKKKRKPRKKQETHKCSSCQKEFGWYPKYKRHMLEEHQVTLETPPFTCSKCNKHFSSQTTFDNHQDTHKTPEQKLNACPYCSKKFKKNKLRGHIREMHVGEKPFVCDDCGKAYTTFGNLKEHKLTHSEERPFKCRYCEKCFKNKPRLRTHEDTHNDTNYICTSCGLQLNTRRTLNMHMLVHSDQKQHKCDVCGKEYKRAKNLKIHLIMHAGLKSYMCTFCDKTFTCNANCRIHMNKIHPFELAQLEASGKKVTNANIPKLEDLRAVISKKAIISEPMELDKQIGSTAGVLSMTEGLKFLRGDSNQATTTMLTGPKEGQANNPQQNSFFLHNRMNFGQLHAS